MMYTQDYDESYPPSQTRGETIRYWYEIMQPYTKNEQIFYCPSSTVTNRIDRGNYGVNQHLMDQGTSTFVHKTLSSVVAPASTYLVFESGMYRDKPSIFVKDNGNAHGGGYYIPGQGKYGLECGNKDYMADCENGRHFDGVVITFADGHAKWIKTQEVIQQAKRMYNENKSSAWDPNSDNS